MCFLNILIVSVLVLQNCLADFPADIPKCKHSDVVCIAKVTTDIIRNNPNGRSDLGLPKIDPLHLKEIVFSDGGGVVFKLHFKDVYLEGLSNITVDKVEGFTEDPETSKFEISSVFPSIHIKGKYTADGKVLILPIQGEGGFDIVLENVRVITKFKPIVKGESGKTHLGVKQWKSKIEPSKMTIAMDGLFNGDKILGENMNAFLNENWKDIWTEVSPGVNSAMSNVSKDLLIGIFGKFTYEESFLKE